MAARPVMESRQNSVFINIERDLPMQAATLADLQQYVRVVLADDHAIARNGIAHVLRERFPIAVAGEVSDGLALMEMLAAATPDLLIADLIMPLFEPMSGLREIRARFPTLKILIVATHNVGENACVLLGAGVVDGCYLKEQPLADLLLAVQSLLSGERRAAERLMIHAVRGIPSAVTDTHLTSRQREMLKYLQEGLDNLAIARRVGLSVKTIETYLTHLYRRLGVRSRLEAAVYIERQADVLGGTKSHASFVEMSGGWQHPSGSSSAAAPADGQLAILIVDDQAGYRAKIRRVVGACCPKALIQEASCGQQAMQLVEELRPRLAFVNVALGDECGIACARRIKGRSPATRIVMLSADERRANRRLIRDAGAVAILAKRDLNAASLHLVVDDVIG